MKEVVWRCHVVVYVVIGVVVVASGSSPSVYIRGLIRRIDRGDPNDDLRDDVAPKHNEHMDDMHLAHPRASDCVQFGQIYGCYVYHGC